MNAAYSIFCGGGEASQKLDRLWNYLQQKGRSGGNSGGGEGVPLWDSNTEVTNLKTEIRQIRLKDVSDLLSRRLIRGYSTINYWDVFFGP